MEYLYPLKLDPAEKVIKSFNDLNRLTIDSKTTTVLYPTIKETLNENYFNYLGIDWKQVSIHIKHSGVIGNVHRDNWKNKNLFMWAINWVWGSDGFMNYWEDSQIEESFSMKDSGGGYRINGKILSPSEKIYFTPPGVYLVNVSKFHRVSNVGNSSRIAVSIRPSFDRFNRWEDVVDLFQNSLKVI